MKVIKVMNVFAFAFCFEFCTLRPHRGQIDCVYMDSSILVWYSVYMHAERPDQYSYVSDSCSLFAQVQNSVSLLLQK